MAALSFVLRSILVPRWSGILAAIAAAWAFLLTLSPAAQAAEGLPEGVVDRGMDPETGIRWFKVGNNADVYQILGTSTYPSLVAREYLAQVGEPLTLTAIQAQNPDRVFLSCFNARRTGIEKYSIRTGDFGPWEGCPEAQRHLALKAGTSIGIQLKKIPTPDRKREVGEAVFRAFESQDMAGFVAVLQAQSKWFGKGDAIVSAVDGEALKNADLATRLAKERIEEAARQARRADGAEADMQKAFADSAAMRERMELQKTVAAVAAAGLGLCLVAFLATFFRRRAQEHAGLREAHRVEVEAAERRYEDLDQRHAELLRETQEGHDVLAAAFVGRSDVPSSSRPADRIKVLVDAATNAERHEAKALGDLAAARDAVRRMELQAEVAVRDAGILVRLVREGYDLIAEISRMLNEAVVQEGAGTPSDVPPGVRRAQRLPFRDRLGRIHEGIRGFNAQLAVLAAEVTSAPSGAFDGGAQRRRESRMLDALRGIPDGRIDPQVGHWVADALGRLTVAGGLAKRELDLRCVVEPWVRALAHQAGRTVPDLSALPLPDLLRETGPVIDRLVYMQGCVDAHEASQTAPAREAPKRPPHPTDVAELSAQGVFGRVLRDVERLLGFFEQGVQDPCLVPREDAIRLVRAFSAERFRSAPESPSTSLFRILGASVPPGFLPREVSAAQ